MLDNTTPIMSLSSMAMLVELRRVIPAFLTRVDRPDRGEAWSLYLARTRAEATRVARLFDIDGSSVPAEEVTLTDVDPEGEAKER